MLLIAMLCSVRRHDIEQEDFQKRKLFDFSDDLKPEEDPEQYFRSIGQITSVRLPRIGKMGKIMAKQASQADVKDKTAPKDNAATTGAVADVAEETDDVIDGFADDEEAGSGATANGQASPDAKRKSLLSRSESQNFADDKTDARSVRFPPITNSQRVVKSQSVYNMATRQDSDLQGRVDNVKKSTYLKTGAKAPSIKTARTMPTPTPHRRMAMNSRLDFQSQKSTKDDQSTAAAAAGEVKDSDRDKDASEQAQRKRKRTSQSDAMLAQVRSETHNISLPVQSWDSNPRPFVNPRFKEIHETLQVYENLRGMTSRDYAIQCLAVANSFKEKPWLAQVHQAMTIAQRGVKKTVGRAPHIFKVASRPYSTTKSVRGLSAVDSEATTTRTFMTA